MLPGLGMADPNNQGFGFGGDSRETEIESDDNEDLDTEDDQGLLAFILSQYRLHLGVISEIAEKILLILSVCALLLCLWMPFLVITSAPSFHGSSHDLWLMFSFVSPCLLCLYSWCPESLLFSL